MLCLECPAVPESKAGKITRWWQNERHRPFKNFLQTLLNLCIKFVSSEESATWILSESSLESSLKENSGSSNLCKINSVANSNSIKISWHELPAPISWSRGTREGSQILHEYCSHIRIANAYSHSLSAEDVRSFVSSRRESPFLETKDRKRRASNEAKLLCSPKVLQRRIWI